jgi:hypothetical protein
LAIADWNSLKISAQPAIRAASFCPMGVCLIAPVTAPLYLFVFAHRDQRRFPLFHAMVYYTCNGMKAYIT